MITGETQWDIDLIFDIFNDRDANLIVSIPLRNNESDAWYLRGEKSGVYSVKSAYDLLR